MFSCEPENKEQVLPSYRCFLKRGSESLLNSRHERNHRAQDATLRAAVVSCGYATILSAQLTPSEGGVLASRETGHSCTLGVV